MNKRMLIKPVCFCAVLAQLLPASAALLPGSGTMLKAPKGTLYTVGHGMTLLQEEAPAESFGPEMETPPDAEKNGGEKSGETKKASETSGSIEVILEEKAASEKESMAAEEAQKAAPETREDCTANASEKNDSAGAEKAETIENTEAGSTEPAETPEAVTTEGAQKADAEKTQVEDEPVTTSEEAGKKAEPEIKLTVKKDTWYIGETVRLKARCTVAGVERETSFTWYTLDNKDRKIIIPGETGEQYTFQAEQTGKFRFTVSDGERYSRVVTIEITEPDPMEQPEIPEPAEPQPLAEETLAETGKENAGTETPEEDAGAETLSDEAGIKAHAEEEIPGSANAAGAPAEVLTTDAPETAENGRAEQAATDAGPQETQQLAEDVSAEPAEEDNSAAPAEEAAATPAEDTAGTTPEDAAAEIPTEEKEAAQSSEGEPETEAIPPEANGQPVSQEEQGTSETDEAAEDEPDEAAEGQPLAEADTSGEIVAYEPVEPCSFELAAGSDSKTGKLIFTVSALPIGHKAVISIHIPEVEGLTVTLETTEPVFTENGTQSVAYTVSCSEFFRAGSHSFKLEYSLSELAPVYGKPETEAEKEPDASGAENGTSVGQNEPDTPAGIEEAAPAGSEEGVPEQTPESKPDEGEDTGSARDE